MAQGHYGHPAQKLTWLYAATVRPPPDLIWGRAPGRQRLDVGYHSATERAQAVARPKLKRLTKTECAATPILFRDALLNIARQAAWERATGIKP